VPREKEFEIPISARDKIRVRLTTEHGQLTEVVAQLECEVGGDWLQCRRYDSAHGFFHVHPKPWDTAQDRQVPVESGDLRHGINLAIADLKANWTRYRQELEAAVQGER
jgi:hypothetical protein